MKNFLNHFCEEIGDSIFSKIYGPKKDYTILYVPSSGNTYVVMEIEVSNDGCVEISGQLGFEKDEFNEGDQLQALQLCDSFTNTEPNDD
jgi:hypothetical protein